MKKKSQIEKSKTSEIILFLTLLCCTLTNGQTDIKNGHTLPKFSEMKYISIPTVLDSTFSNNSCQENISRFVKNYYKRLNNINGIEVYLVKESCNFSPNTCLCFEVAAQGEFNFLVLINKKSKKAKVFICSFNFLSDSEVYDMTFKIKGNEIKLIESGYTEGEKSAEKFFKSTHKVLILKNGQIQVD